MSSKRAIGDVRPSQVITTFGPGAIVDLQTLSVIVAGIDGWHLDEDRVIHEPRLQRALKVKRFFPQSRLVETISPSGGLFRHFCFLAIKSALTPNVQRFLSLVKNWLDTTKKLRKWSAKHLIAKAGASSVRLLSQHRLLWLARVVILTNSPGGPTCIEMPTLTAKNVCVWCTPVQPARYRIFGSTVLVMQNVVLVKLLVRIAALFWVNVPASVHGWGLRIKTRMSVNTQGRCGRFNVAPPTDGFL